MAKRSFAAGLSIAALATTFSASAAPVEPPSDVLPSREDSWDIPGRYVVDASEEAGPLAAFREAAARLGVSLVPSDLAEETHIYEFDAADPAVAAELSRAEGVERLEPLAWVRAMFTPDDPLLKDQWHMTRVNAPAAWDYATGYGVTVAVVDTGIACETHGPFNKGSDLANTSCTGGWNFVSNDTHANDDQGHGTHVAGTIAQSTNNGIGAVGLAFNARLMPVKVLNENGWGTTQDVADGIRWAADHGAHVINLSLGGPRNSKVLQDAVDHARSKGVIVVAAAGNSGGAVGFPGASEGVIGVSATDPDDKIAKFSSRGPEIDIGAPGVNVVQQTVCNRGRDKCERYPGYNGTSMATPHVAGAAALLVSLGVTDAAAVESILKDSARVVDDSDAGKKLYGAGVLDAGAAVRSVTFKQDLFRVVATIAVAAFAFVAARRKNASSASPLSPAFVLGALITGPGLFFLAPFVLSRASLPIDFLARPLGDLDLYLGASLHKLLPLANVFVPGALTALLFQNKAARPLIAGVAAGTAGYLAATVAMQTAAGGLLFTAWCAGNAFLCALLARFCLSETR